MSVKAKDIHNYFGKLLHYDFSNFKEIPFKNGLFVFFDKKEQFEDGMRIVHIGINEKEGHLVDRIAQHITGSKDGSSLMKEIGRAILEKNGNHHYIPVWQEPNSPDADAEFEKTVKREIQEYLKEHIEIAVIPIDNPTERKRMKSGLLSALVEDSSFKPAPNWLGLNIPKKEIQKGLWNIKGMNEEPLSEEEFEEIKNSYR